MHRSGSQRSTSARTEPSFDKLRTTRRAFTLIELLVVVSIISLLIAILLPSLKEARDAARVTVCMSNQRQVWLGMRMYASEYANMLPAPQGVDLIPSENSWHGRGWDEAIAPYLGLEVTWDTNGRPPKDVDVPVLRCPLDSRAAKRDRAWRSYAVNSGDAVIAFLARRDGIAADTDEPMRLNAFIPQGKYVGSRTNILILGDYYMDSINGRFGDRRGIRDKSRWDNWDPSAYRFHPLEPQTRNALFLDGHVATFFRKWNGGWWREHHTGYTMPNFQDGE
jgi:prepilin-type N-terminal cleavage/methylation domain-containing protein/prepilin-type processing-associated H-X9-DG protein